MASPDDFCFPLADRTEWPLETNELEKSLRALKAAGHSVIDLTLSNPTRCGFLYPEQEILAALNTPDNLSYTPDPRGLSAAREAVRRDYHAKGVEVPLGNIFLTSSTSEAYSFVFRLLLNPGQRVLFPSPSYPLFRFLADVNDAQMDLYPLRYQADAWRTDTAALQRLVTPESRAVVLVHPNNPTGSFVHPQDLQAINALCAQKKMAIICDEVFHDFSLGEGCFPGSLAGNREALTFVLGGLSKTLGLPQMKLSWIVINGPDALVQKCAVRLEVIADTFLSVNTVTQNALPAWLALKEEIQSAMRKRTVRNFNFLQERLASEDKVALLNAEGGWYAVIRLEDDKDEEAFVLTLLREKHVYAHPGYFFDFDQGSFLILSLILPPDDFKEGVERIVQLLSA